MVQPSWCRRLFSRARRPDSGAANDEAGPEAAEAQFALGSKYSAAAGDSPDLAQAVQCYRKAADQHHPLAQFSLGLMYAKGQGVPQDDAEAVRWFRGAAQQGHAGAQFELAMKYHRASVWGLQLDGLKSKVEAYKWLQLAAAQGYKGSAEAYERVTLAMTQEEVDEGNQGAASLVAGKPADLKAQ